MNAGFAFSVFRGYEEIDRDEPPRHSGTGGCTEKEFWRFFLLYCLRSTMASECPKRPQSGP